MPRLIPGERRLIRTILVIFAIAAMLCVSAVAVSPAHAHLNSPVDQCNICVSAHMAVKQVALIQLIHTVGSQSFLPPPSVAIRLQSRSILALLTRGPPSSL